MDVHWTPNGGGMTASTGETERVNFRANKATKREAERVIRAMGLNLSDLLNMFLARVAAEHRVPFPLAMTREEILAPQTVELGHQVTGALGEEASRRAADGAPVARYDRARGQAYIQYADGHKQYVDA